METKNTDNLSATGAADENVTEKKAENNVDADVQDVPTDAQDQTKANFEQKYNEYYDKYLRLSADFDNYRKRVSKEKVDLLKYAGEDVLKALLPVVDDLERGMKFIETAKDVDAVKEGMILINNKFKEFLSQRGLKEIDALGKEFNVDVHEAITKIPVTDKAMSGKVVDVTQKGFMWDEKVLRFSKVVIGE